MIYFSVIEPNCDIIFSHPRESAFNERCTNRMKHHAVVLLKRFQVYLSIEAKMQTFATLTS